VEEKGKGKWKKMREDVPMKTTAAQRTQRRYWGVEQTAPTRPMRLGCFFFKLVETSVANSIDFNLSESCSSVALG
jgi:hypothetical protein